jgi:TonB-linked SusC/RagA family outer membrane protein
MKRLCVFFALVAFVGINILHAQTVQITGTVISAEDGMPVPGASVMVKGTTTGTSTDANGKYSFAVPQTATTLVFSFIGLKSMEVQIAGRTVIDVTLESDALALEEIVVTALGIRRETKALGYSVQTVSADDIGKSAEQNMMNALNAKVAGVSITSSSGAAGASTFMTIRGFSSITQNNQPLFVIDGVPIDNSQYTPTTLTAGVGHSNRSIDINPDDVESISILKGGAATALYGIRAANGAVIITTKKGKAGEKMQVTYSSSITAERVSQMLQLQDKFAQGSGGNLNLGGTTASFGPKISDLRLNPDVKNVYYPDGVPVLFDPNNPAMANYPKFSAYDNVNSFFQTGLTYNNSLTLSGGTEQTTYFFSLSNLSQEGIVPNNTFNRTTVSVSGETKLSQKFTTSARLAYTNSGGNRIQQGSNTSGVMLALYRMPVSFDMTGGTSDPVNDPKSYMFTDGSGRQRNAYNGGGYDNPFWTVNKNSHKDDVNRLIGNWNISFAATDWLNFSYRLGTDFYSDRRKDIIAINSRTIPTGQVYEDHYFRQDINSDLMANMDFYLTDDLRTTIILGQNMYQFYYQNMYSRIGGLVIPDYYNLSNSASQFAFESHSKKRTAALYGDIGLEYKSMIFFNATLRNEWSTSLPKENNSFMYPSFSGSFIFTELPILSGNKNLSFGKLRASYAIIGNDAPIFATGQYFISAATTDGWTNTAIQFPAFGTPAYNLSTTLANPDLKPETSTSMEFGIDLRFLDNRVGIDFTYFQLKNEDLILSVPIAGSSGFTSANMNAATMENKGFEVVLKLVPFKTKDFTWNADFNFTILKNEVTQLAEGVTSVFLGGFVGKQVRAVVGNPYGSIFGTDFKRDAKDNMIIQDNSALPGYGYPINDPIDKNIGNVLPDWTLGINNAFNYKSVSFSFLWDIKSGGKMWNGTRGAGINFGMTPDTESRGEAYVFPGVKSDGTPNDITVYPGEAWYTALGGGFNGPGRPYVDDTSWVRLREISLGYRLPKAIVSRAGMSSAEVYVTGKNLLLFTPYDGVDPETSLYGADNAQGLDYYNMPGVKSLLFGLKLNF